jgi:aryl-alcohol dehydrogenase-like predicted oxidoreductase
MEKRKIGRSDLEIAPLVFGGNVFGWTADEAMSFRLLDAFVDAGFNAIDTADTYSRWVPGNRGGESETIIGKWLKQSGKRNRVLIFTKVGHEMAPDKKGLKRGYILSSAEDSLKRLGIDRIDLYQSHRDDPATPMQETLAAYGELIKTGKVRAIGASNFSAKRLREALDVAAKHSVPRYECLQPNYNLYNRSDYESDLEPLCLKEQIGCIPYYALASGFLTGKYRSAADFGKSARGGAMSSYLNARGLRILGALDQVAAAHHTTQAAVALAWLMARPSITAPIASATNPGQVKDFTAAARLHLSAADIAALDSASGGA